MPRLIPSFELYGEMLSGSLADPVHHETIHDRSSKLDWTIRLHRHRRLLQIFLFRTPEIHLQVGDLDHLTAGPLILVVPPEVPHGFRFPENASGHVLTVPLSEIHPQVLERLRQITRRNAGILPESATSRFDAVEMLIRQVETAFHAMGSERAALLKALTHAVILTLMEELRATGLEGQPTPASDLTLAERQAQAFCERLEARFAEADTVSDYAAHAGISAPHLSRICKRVLGASPGDLVRQRRLLEARRLLGYTRLPVAEVAHRSGFGDAAFFSRAFKETTGLSPRDFRKQLD